MPLFIIHHALMVCVPPHRLIVVTWHHCFSTMFKSLLVFFFPSQEPELDEYTSGLELEEDVMLDSTGMFHWCSPIPLQEVSLVKYQR